MGPPDHPPTPIRLLQSPIRVPICSSLDSPPICIPNAIEQNELQQSYEAKTEQWMPKHTCPARYSQLACKSTKYTPFDLNSENDAIDMA
eukprot:1144870-Pelagomonas_calceolata.AAC.2